MEAHLLLHQLLEEYGITGHNSIDESVSEYVIEAVSEDTLGVEEKREFVRDIILELATLDEALSLQFVEDLTHAAKQLLHGKTGNQGEFPVLTSTTDATGSSADATSCVTISTRNTTTSTTTTSTPGDTPDNTMPRRCDGRDINKELRSAGGDENSRSGSNQARHRKGQRTKKGTPLFKNGQRVNTLSNVISDRGTGAVSGNSSGRSSGAPPDTISSTISHPPADRSLAPLKKLLCKYLSSSDAACLDDEVLTCVFQVCCDPLLSAEDKREMLFSYLPDMRQQANLDATERGHHVTEKDRDIIAGEVVAVARQVHKTKEQELKQADRTDSLTDHTEIATPEPTAVQTAISTFSPSNSSSSAPASSPTPAMQELLAMLPHLDPPDVQYVLEVKFLHDHLQAAQFLLEHNADEETMRALAQEREAYWAKKQAQGQEQDLKSAAEAQRMKSTIFERYGETEMTPTEFLRAASRSGDAGHLVAAESKSKGKGGRGGGKVLFKSGGKPEKGGVRYRDGVVATYTGEKVVMVGPRPVEYDGGSRGTIKTKGKRGPGFIKT